MTTTEDAHDFYDRLGLIVMSGEMGWNDKTGKKEFAFRKGWQTLGRHEYNRKASGFALRTGKGTGITVIDIDDPALEHNLELMDLMTECNMVQETKKGFHYVFAYDDRITQTTDDKLKLDVRNDGGCIFAEPSIAYDECGDVRAVYGWTKKPEIGEALTILPDAVVAYLGKLNKRYLKQIREEVKETESIETNASDPVDAPETDLLLLKVIAELPTSVLDNYSDWIKIGMVLCNEGYTCSQWDEVSKRSSKYSAGACETHWKSFANPNGKRKVMNATLWKMLKSANEPAFWVLMEQRQDFWNLISQLNHCDSAKYFYNINPDKYLWNEVMGWFSIQTNNTWKGYEKAQPSGLKRGIADVMQGLCVETKKAELSRYARESGATTDQDTQKAISKKHLARITAIQVAYKQFGSSEFGNGVCAYLNTFYEKDDLEKLMNMNKNLFAFTDAVVDLETGQKRAIMPSDYISLTCGYAYPKKSDPGMRARINKFLFGMFENQETADYLFRVLSSCLFGGNRWEEFYCFTGKGSNGKGLLADCMTAVFGDFYHTVDVTLFTKPLERKDQPIPALVDARYKRMMMTSEPEPTDTLQGGLIKKISGGDPVEARTLNSKHIVRYVPPYKLVIQANGVPAMNRIDLAIQRRMRVIDFPLVFKESADKMTEPHHRLGDPDLKYKESKKTEWRDEMMLMMLETYDTIKNLKCLPRPASVEASTGAYLDDNNPLKSWLEDKYIKTGRSADYISSSQMIQDYSSDTGTERMDSKKFKKMMEFNGFDSKRLNSCNCAFVGLQRKAERLD